MKITSDKFPKTSHYAALVFSSQTIYHEGDERSRTCPGHGYGAHSETINTIDYIVFNSVKEMEEWVLKEETKTYNKTVYQLIEARPLKASITATVKIN